MSEWVYDRKSQRGDLKISGALTVARAGELKERLLKSIGQAQTVRVDLAQTGPVDIAGIQLLCAAHRLACSQGKTLILMSVPAELRELIRNAGFTHAAVCCREREGSCLWGERS